MLTCIVFAGALLAQTAQEAPPPAPRELAVGTSATFRPGLVLQGWFVSQSEGPFIRTGDHADPTTSTFRMRRAEMHLKGDIVPGRVSYALMIDAAKVLEPVATELSVEPAGPAGPQTVTVEQAPSALSVFQDFFITYQHAYADVSLGQFKIPVSWEGYNSSSKLLFPERAMVSRQFGDKRDIGLRIAKTFAAWGYSAGLFNGASLNTLDTNNAKDGALRLEAYPLKGMLVGGVVYATLAERDQRDVRDRYEGDLRYEHGPLLVQAEYIRARDVKDPGAITHGHGFYAAAAWTLFETLQPCLRVGMLDPDLAQDLDPLLTDGKDEVWHFDLGLNYYVQKNEAKLQLAYQRAAYQDKTAVNELILAAQVSY